MLDEMNFSKLQLIDWFKNYTNWLPIMRWSGWIISVFILAKIFWIWFFYFIQPMDVKPFKVTNTSHSTISSSIDISTLLEFNLFGDEQQKIIVEAPQANAPVTRLALKLRGIFAAETLAKANAIIEDNAGKQAVYFIDDKLKVAGQVFLREVHVDHIIIESNGKRETLKLEGSQLPSLKISQSNKKRNNKVQDKRNDQQLSRKLNRYRNKLMSDPRSVADVIAGRPHVVNDELKGFKISPGKDKRLFQELGLRRGDVVTSINGIALTNMQDAMRLMADAQTLQELSVNIERNGESLSLLLNLNDKIGF